MVTSIFPRKFGGTIDKHFKILSQELKEVHKKRVLELASGSGSAVHFLSNDNIYTGTDISPGLMKKTQKNFRDAGFKDAQLLQYNKLYC
jgi:methylase of polypeptide subunit release factors